MQTHIPNSVFQFLQNLSSHNDREWFAEHKKTYQAQHALVTNFADTLIKEMNQHDDIETPTGKKACFRIYRDVRFSKNKEPYKTNMGMHLKRATALKRGGYYINIKPGECFIGGGFWGPNPSDLKLIRTHIATNASPLRKVLNSNSFKQTFGTLNGNQVKTAPKGFAKDHKNIDLLRYKQFLVGKPFKDSDFKNPKFIATAIETLLALRPFFDCMSEMLTTDLNGVPLYE